MRSLITIASLICLLPGVVAQTSLSMYHLGNSTFQHTYFNAASMPKGRAFVGLPLMSGVHFNFNNRLSYNELISENEEGGKEIDLQKAFNKLQRVNMLSFHSNINLFYGGFTAPAGATIYLFANERVEMDFLYPKSLIQFAVKGNTSQLNEDVKVGKTRLSLNHFREIGAGYRYRLDEHRMNIGFRVKYYQGFFNASTPGNMRAVLRTESENHQLNIEMKNVAVRTSGLSILDLYNIEGEGDPNVTLIPHLIFNNNWGMGADVGFEYDVNRYYSISASLNDLGFISWREDIQNREAADTTFRYTGLELKGLRNLQQTVQDSLFNRLKPTTTNSRPYTTWAGPRMYLSWISHLTPRNDVIATLGSRLVQGQIKLLYGVGINHKIDSRFIGSFNITKLPQQLPNVGAAFAVRGGPAQFYVAVDQVGNWSVTDFQSFDFRTGIQLIFGYGKPPKQPGGPKSAPFLGKRVETRGKEGIYTIIGKQKRRKIKN